MILIKKINFKDENDKLEGNIMKLRPNTIIQICINDELNEAEKAYDEYLEKIQEYCENDSLQVKQHLIKFLVKHYEEMINKICSKKIQAMKYVDAFSWHERKEQLLNITNEEKLQELKEYTKDSLLEHELFYKLNKNNLATNNNLESIYSNLLSLYDLNLYDLEQYICSFNKNLKQSKKRIFAHNYDKFNQNNKKDEMSNSSKKQSIIEDTLRVCLNGNYEFKHNNQVYYFSEKSNSKTTIEKELLKIKEYINE